MRRMLLGGVLLSLAFAAAAAEPREFRLFSVAYRHDVTRVESYETFRQSIRDQFVADIQPRLATDRPNLVTYPENQTLMAYLVGARGAASRETLASGQPNSSSAAIASLAGPYGPQVDYYQGKFPGVDSPGQLLHLALTDTLARVVVETFGPLADEFDVYIAVSGNLAPFERVEGAAAVALGDPEAGTTYAYEATAPDVYNRNFFFGPDGALIAIQDKAYLVPIERTRDVGLGLTGIEVHELPVVDLPFARVGTVISKDAWMPDVNDRYDQLGAELLVQSEAFSTWGVAGADLWPPDKFQRGGWWMVQKHPAIRVNATPMLTGNFGDLTFDGQPLIAVKAPAGVPGLCLMGQAPEPGWAAVGAWANYTDAPSTFCAPSRRDEFRMVAEALLPGSGDALENAYAEDVVYADITLPARGTAARVASGGFGASVAVAGDAAQLQPALSPDGAWLAWVDARLGRNQSVFAAKRAASGWAEPVAVEPQAVTDYDHFDNQWSPTIVSDGLGAAIAYLGFPTENWDLFLHHLDADGQPNGIIPRIDDADTDAGVQRERGHSSPVLVRAPDGALLAAWSDLRWPWVKPQVRVSRSSDGGLTWSPSARADGRPVTFEDEQHDARDPNESRGQAFPAVAFADGALLVAWQELSADGVPAIWLGRSTDGGGSFGTPVRVSDVPAAWRPALVASAGAVWLAYEEETASGGRQLRIRLSRDGGEGFEEARALDRSAPAAVTQRYARLLPYRGGALAVFEDDRAGDSDVLAVAVSIDGDRGAPMRIDDGPAGAHARVPAAAVLADGSVLVAWQDTREGAERIRTAVGAAPASAGRRRGGGGTIALAIVGIMLLAGLRRVLPLP